MAQNALEFNNIVADFDISLKEMIPESTDQARSIASQMKVEINVRMTMENYRKIVDTVWNQAKKTVLTVKIPV